MLNSKTLLTGAALLIATTSTASTASAAGFSKSYEWGSNNFGVEIAGSASGSANNKGKISIDADGSFKARLFGGSKTAKATFDGAYGDGTRKMSANLKIDGIVLSSKSKTFGSAYVEKPLQSKELLAEAGIAASASFSVQK